MAIKSDRWIREQAQKHGMIAPFSEKQVREGVISYGLSSYGYDLRVSDEFKIFTNVNSAIIDPKAFDERSFVTVTAETIIVPPNSFALARSIEYFKIPRDVLTICVGKSTYARCGIIVNVTPFEPEWEGYVTLEISNTTPLPARIYANEGLCQILFFQSDEVCEVSYADRKGKYQHQQGIVLLNFKRPHRAVAVYAERVEHAGHGSESTMEESHTKKPGDTGDVGMVAGVAAPKAAAPLRVGMVATDPLRIAGMQSILQTGPAGREPFAEVVPLSVPGILNDGGLRIVMLDASCTDHLFELLETFRRVRPMVRLIVIGDSEEQEYIQRVIGAGAKGYLTQTAREAEIRLALEIVEDGSVWAPRKVLARLLDSTSDNGVRGAGKVEFTAREVEVLRYLVTGLGNREIAEALGIDETTIKAHITRLMRKVRVTNRIGLTLHALDYDLGENVSE